MRRAFVIAPLLVVINWVVYFQVADFEFVNYDDPRFVVDNPYVRRGLTAGGMAWAFQPGTTENWHPLTWLSLMLDAELYHGPPGEFEQAAGGFHVTNVVLHTLNTLLLFAALWTMTGAPYKSGIVAALFAVHPLHVESVAWISERKDVLSTFFGLLALWSYAAYALRRGKAWYGLSLLAFLASLLSKQMLVTLPFVFLLLDYWPLRRTNRSNAGALAARTEATITRRWLPLVLEKIPFLVLSGVFCVVVYTAQQATGTIGETLPAATRFKNAVVAYVLYLSKAVWPVELAFFYPLSPDAIPLWQVFAALALLASITLLALWQARQRPYLPVGWFWYLGTLVPVIGFVQIGLQRMADRYTYVPLVGVFMAVCWLAGSLWPSHWRWRAAIGGLGLAVVGVLMVLAYRQVSVWKDGVTLLKHAIAVTDDNYLAHENLSVALAKQGRYREALEHSREAIRLTPNNAGSYVNLGARFMELGQPQAALQAFQNAVQLDPQSPRAHSNLGSVLKGIGRNEEAVAHYKVAVELRPDDPFYHTNLGFGLIELSRLEEAVNAFREAIRRNPDYARAHCGRGIALRLQNNFDAAVAACEQALRARPGYAMAHRNLAMALQELGRLDEALHHYNEALRFGSRDPRNHVEFAELLMTLGRARDAADLYRQALQLDPRSAYIRIRLGDTLVDIEDFELARRMYQEALQIDPASSAAHYGLGVVYLRLGQRDGAMRHFNEAVRLQPDFPAATGQLRRLRAAGPAEEGQADEPRQDDTESK